MKNIFDDEELDERVVVAKIAITTEEIAEAQQMAAEWMEKHK